MKAIVSAVISLCIFSVILFGANAQECRCSDETIEANAMEESIEIGEKDYEYFMNLKALKNHPYVKRFVSDVIFGESNYIVEGISYSNNISLYARYSRDGDLISGELVKKDVALPLIITSYLTENYSDWIIKSNKISVKNFLTEKTIYEVKIKNDKTKQKQTLQFNHYGKAIP